MNSVAPIAGPCAWLGKDMAQSTRWVRDLRPEHVEELEAGLAHVDAMGLAWDEITADTFPLPGLAGLIEDIREELENGSGLMKVRGLPVSRYSEDQLRKIYYGLGSNIGMPVFQNRHGELMRFHSR